MSLSPRRTLAVGLVGIVSGFAIYAVGAGVAFWMATRESSGLNFVSLSERMTDVMGSFETAQRISTIVGYVAGPLILLGILMATIGAVRWLWAEPSDGIVDPAAS